MKCSLLCAVIVSATSSAARADCAGPTADILWSYPDDSTPSVPPDAVLWAVAHVGTVEMEIDGVRLSPRATEGTGRYQFAPAAPLAEGSHELRAWSSGDGGSEAEERSIRFDVVAGAAASGDVFVDTVTAFPLVFGTDGALTSPPPDEYDTSCSALAVPLEWSCNDIIPYGLVQVTYAPEGAPIAYLVQGDTLVPAGCPMFWAGGSGDSDPSTFRVAAVLATGLGEERVFTGNVEERTLPDIYPERFQKRGSALCSFQAGDHRAGAGTVLPWLMAACAWAWAARRSSVKAVAVENTGR
jgi:hypothetical protein